jgi:prophage tail gpP-like protein
MELANPETDITAGMRCDLFVNGKRELTGLIDKVHRRVHKNGVSLAVAGRDLMGLLIDSYCERWLTLSGKTLKGLAEMLLKDVPFINRKAIVYQENIIGKGKGKKKASGKGGSIFAHDAAQKIAQIEPGMTIFEVLKTYSLSRGLLFYCLPNGTFVFGRPLAKGDPAFNLQLLRSGTGNNVIESDVMNDISKRYSKITVVGQQQGSQSIFAASGINTKTATAVVDNTFPFYKPFVPTDNNDSLSPKEHARMIMEKHRREGRHLHYKVGRHNQDGANWSINELCRVKDEAQGVDGVYLIYGRTFEMNKKDGPTTKLKLGEPGIIA